ncbi:peptidoglycan recognition protein family protein [Streptomyces sp. NPDC054796]
MRPSRVAVAMALPLVLLVTCDASMRNAAREHRRPGSESTSAIPRPHIVSRAAWHADEDVVRERASYTHGVRAAFIHHTDHENDYDCADSPALLRALQEDHVGRGWDDIGYNFVVDRCGNVYEGRSGGVNRPVRGAHTMGFNDDSIGIALLGTFEEGMKVPDAALTAVAEVIAWKLRPGVDPHGRTRMVSRSDQSRVDKDTSASFDVVSGHRDAYETDCPGDALYAKLPELRDKVARLQRGHLRAEASGG